MTGNKTMEHALLAELLAALQQYAQSTTEAVSHLRGMQANNVLETTLLPIDADGGVTRAYSVPFGAVSVANHGVSEMTVVAGPRGASPPPSGKGVHLVPAGMATVISLTGTQLTIYGNAGDRCSIQVHSKPQPPSFGPAGSAPRTLTVVTPDPVAGAEISQTVPAGQVWQLLAVRFTLITSAVVANRRVNLVFDDGVNAFAKIGSFAAQAASLTQPYTWVVGGVFASPSDQVSPLPAIQLPAGYRIRTSTVSLDPGDDFGPAVITYQRIV